MTDIAERSEACWWSEEGEGGLDTSEGHDFTLGLLSGEETLGTCWSSGKTEHRQGGVGWGGRRVRQG